VVDFLEISNEYGFSGDATGDREILRKCSFEHKMFVLVGRANERGGRHGNRD
jgi:hypothetical protein